ncbi:B3 domain-containing protein [Cardamine amara subsp. amara]|uniref:B3 domain-containing protein n=1 Tax=Cardamine amara subsp. amara TaxID=228776 RepID=A0ABD1AL91_CARAN
MMMNETGRVKTEQREEGIHSDVKEEDVVVSSEMSQPVPTRAESNGGRSYKRKLFESGKKKAEESHKTKKTKKQLFSVGRDNNAGASSSTSSELTIVITKAYLTHLGIKRPFARVHMPDVNKVFKIHHEDMEKSWNVTYLSSKRDPESNVERNPCFSAGWSRLAKEYPIVIGDTCKLTHIKLDEMLLAVSKPTQ